MYNKVIDYNQTKCDPQVRHATLRERISFQNETDKTEIARLTKRIKEGEAILVKLKKNPELESIVDFMQSGR